jgi:sugar (pentulose or hexulose) kinase
MKPPMEFRDPFFAVFDFGTGGGKCAIFDAEGRRVAVARQPWTYQTVPFEHSELTAGFAFDPHAFWAALSGCARRALEEAELPADAIAAIGTTAQRLGTIFLDARGREIYAAPNMDGRGLAGAFAVIEKLGMERTIDITGHWPPFVSTLARLLSYRSDPTRPPIAYVLTLNDWIAYRLSGALTSEPSNACESSLLDVGARRWSRDILDTFEIDERILPPLVEPSSHIGRLTAEAAEQVGLRAGTPVYAGGADTQCALLGSGVVEPGTAAVVLGTTAPVMVVTDAPHPDRDGRLWTGCHVVPDRWTLESNAGDAGIGYEWWLDVLGLSGEEGFAQADALMAEGPELPEPVWCFTGPTVFDLQNFNPSRPHGILYRRPPFAPPPSRGALLRSLMGNLACAIRANLEQLEAARGGSPTTITLSGGMTRGAALIRSFARFLRTPMQISGEAHATALGATVLAAVGHGTYPDLASATAAMVRHRPLAPQGEHASAYDAYYAQWRENYDRLKAQSL